MKRCIVYCPYEILEQGDGARMLRPRKMIQAFRDIGYDVFVIHGYSKSRRKLIAECKKMVLNGTKFEFMYIENSTEPTLLTDPHHLPTHPFLDYGFYQFAKRHGIPMGLFYSDIFWKFDTYGRELPKWKRFFALKCYELDLKMLPKYLKKFYLPDKMMNTYLKVPYLAERSEELPPGCEQTEVKNREPGPVDFSERPLQLFYVGGLGGVYQIGELISAVAGEPDVVLTVCCRKAEWDKESATLSKLLANNISIIHKKGKELEPYFAEADLCSLMFLPGSYMSFAKPFKAYEYLANEIPVLSSKGTAIGEFVERSNIGWNINYSAEEIRKVVCAIKEDPGLLQEKRDNCKTVKQSQLWTVRARQVEEGLLK